MASKTTLPPPMDPRLGDKTPEYVTWLAKEDGPAWLKRYAGRKILGIWVPPGATEIPGALLVLMAAKPFTQPPGDLPLGEIPPEPKEEYFSRKK